MSPPRAKKSFARPLADLIGGAIDPALAKQGFGENSVILCWDEIVGERLAGVSEPLKMQWPPRGPKRAPDAPVEPATLVLRVESGFAIEFQHIAPVVIERVNAHLGWRCVGKLAYRQGPLQRAKTRAGPKPLDPVALAAARAETADIADEPLREALTRLGAHTLNRKSTPR